VRPESGSVGRVPGVLELSASTVGLLQELGALAPSVDADEAAETLAAIADFRFALVLRES
jgi:hypothetical protein